VPSKLRGLSNARNTGIEAAAHPILGFIDDDCIPARNWVEATHRAIARDPQSSVWIGQDYPEASAISEAAIANLKEISFSKHRTADPWSIGPTGGNSFFRRSTFEQVGLFDPRLGQGSDYPGAEDGDMIYRVLKAGLRVTYTNTIRVHHVEWRSDDQSVDNSYNYGYGVGAMLAKYYDHGDYFPLAVIFTRRFLSKYIAVPVWLMLGQMNRYRHSVKWCQSIYTGFRRWRREQQPDGSYLETGKGA
jgi:GT2 family glycosyltransferase